MPADPLPRFMYHPDPLATGSIEKSDDECACCSQSRGYIYIGPAFGQDYDDEPICPWCIADGRAHAELGVTFHDEASIPGSDFAGAPNVSEAVIAEVSQRTPVLYGLAAGAVVYLLQRRRRVHGPRRAEGTEIALPRSDRVAA